MTDTSERTSEEAPRPHGASFVCVYLEEAGHEGGDREQFLGRVRFRLSKLNLSDAVREEVFNWAQTLAERLPVRLVTTVAVDEAGQLTRQIAQELRQPPHADVLKRVEESWPSIIAHEVARLLGDLAGEAADGSRRAVSPEAVLFQLRDVVETLIKFPTLA